MPESGSAKKKLPHKTILLGLLVAAGVILHLLGWFDWRRLIEEGEKFAHTWWFAPAVIMIKIALYTFALPGSVMFWVAGLFFDPIAATLIILAGGVGGAMTAYSFSRSMSRGEAGKLEASRFFKLLKKHTDFATLCAVRTLPNFPHTIINYGSGILDVPFPRFILSTVVGYSIKGYLYASMIRRAATAEGLSEAICFRTVGSLIILAALFMAGKAMQRFDKSNGPE